MIRRMLAAAFAFFALCAPRSAEQPAPRAGGAPVEQQQPRPPAGPYMVEPPSPDRERFRDLDQTAVDRQRALDRQRVVDRLQEAERQRARVAKTNALAAVRQADAALGALKNWRGNLARATEPGAVNRFYALGLRDVPDDAFADLLQSVFARKGAPAVLGRRVELLAWTLYPAARSEADVTAREVATAIASLTSAQRATIAARYDAAAALLRRELLVLLRAGDLPADAVVRFATADSAQPDHGLLQLAVVCGSDAARRWLADNAFKCLFSTDGVDVFDSELTEGERAEFLRRAVRHRLLERADLLDDHRRQMALLRGAHRRGGELSEAALLLLTGLRGSANGLEEDLAKFSTAGPALRNRLVEHFEARRGGTRVVP